MTVTIDAEEIKIDKFVPVNLSVKNLYYGKKNESKWPFKNFNKCMKLLPKTSREPVSSLELNDYSENSIEVTCRDVEQSESLLLKNTNICAKPGQLVAIMGPSGAGKTTLLNCLSGRLSNNSHNSIFEGEIYINNKLQSAKSLRKSSSYVLQNDCLLDSLTVRETLEIVAEFKNRKNIRNSIKMPSSNFIPPDVNIKAIIDELINDLNLTKCQNTYIGNSDLVKGISGGELKRTCIGISLLDNPSLLFLDEPTSGLDSALALDVMSLLVKLARRGRTIICTIHQPASHMFALFNHLILLSEGNIVYQGPAHNVSNYFANLGYICPPNFNPADFVLDLLVAKKNSYEQIDNIKYKDDLELKKSKCNDTTKSQQIEDDLIRNNMIENDKNQYNIDIKYSSLDFNNINTLNTNNNNNYYLNSNDSMNTNTDQPPNESFFLLNGFRLKISEQKLNQLPHQYLQSEEAQNVLIDINRCISSNTPIKYESPDIEKLCGRSVLKNNGESIIKKKKKPFNLSIIFNYLKYSLLMYVFWMKDVVLISKRSALNAFRHPVVGLASLMIHCLLAVALGGIWFQLRDSSDKPTNVFSIVFQGGAKAVSENAKLMASDFRNTCGALFFMIIFFGFSALSSMISFQQERVVFNRETSSGLYSTSAFYFGKIIADAPFQHVPASIFMLIFYWMVGLEPSANQFGVFILIGNLTVFSACGLFYSLGAVVQNVQIANLIAPILLTTCMLVAGFFINVKDLPAWINWLRNFSFIKNSFAALAVNQFPPEDQYGFMKNVQWLEALGVVDLDLWSSINHLFYLGMGLRLIAYIFLTFTNRRVGLEV